MFEFETMWDLYEFKLLMLFVTAIVAVVLGNYIYDKTKTTKRKNTDNDT